MDSVANYVERLRRRAPEYLDLITSETAVQFDEAFDLFLEKAVSRIEADSKKFFMLDEEGISSVLALALTMPGLQVDRELNSNGHVDITVVADHCYPLRKKLGEAKIYDGPKKHIDGVEQLLTRYTTGREGRGFLIVYFKVPGISTLISKIRTEMDDKKPLSQIGETTDHVIKWSFISVHLHSCGDALEVEHIGCNLYSERAGHVVDASNGA